MKGKEMKRECQKDFRLELIKERVAVKYYTDLSE